MKKQADIVRYLKAEDQWWIGANFSKHAFVDIQFDPYNAIAGKPHLSAHIYVFQGDGRNHDWEHECNSIPAAVVWINSTLKGFGSRYRVKAKKDDVK